MPKVKISKGIDVDKLSQADLKEHGEELLLHAAESQQAEQLQSLLRKVPVTPAVMKKFLDSLIHIDRSNKELKDAIIGDSDVTELSYKDRNKIVMLMFAGFLSYQLATNNNEMVPIILDKVKSYLPTNSQEYKTFLYLARRAIFTQGDCALVTSLRSDFKFDNPAFLKEMESAIKKDPKKAGLIASWQATVETAYRYSDQYTLEIATMVANLEEIKQRLENTSDTKKVDRLLTAILNNTEENPALKEWQIIKDIALLYGNEFQSNRGLFGIFKSTNPEENQLQQYLIALLHASSAEIRIKERTLQSPEITPTQDFYLHAFTIDRFTEELRELRPDIPQP